MNELTDPGALQELCHETMPENLGIEFTEVNEERLCARMPVDERTIQPRGFLHGGASVTLAETIGSLASAIRVDLDHYDVRGIEINANHVGGIRSGWVEGIATPIHLGRTTHIWDIRTRAEQEGRLISVCRLTIMIIPKEDQ